MRGIHRRATSPALLRKTTPAPNHPTTAPARAQAGSLGLDHKNADGLKNFNKNKKLIKKFGARGPSRLPSSSPHSSTGRPTVEGPVGDRRRVAPTHPHNPHYPPRL